MWCSSLMVTYPESLVSEVVRKECTFGALVVHLQCTQGKQIKQMFSSSCMVAHPIYLTGDLSASWVRFSTVLNTSISWGNTQN